MGRTQKGVEPQKAPLWFQENQQRQCYVAKFCSHPNLKTSFWIWKDRPRDLTTFILNLILLGILALEILLWLLGDG